VTKARVLSRDKDRTKNGEDRTVELCPRALEVLKRHLALREKMAAAGKVKHADLFFHPRWPPNFLHPWPDESPPPGALVGRVLRSPIPG
jgi:hypothetical protein